MIQMRSVYYLLSRVHFTNNLKVNYNHLQVVERDKRVAFIGISNWALDPAKMNRGIMVTRTDPDLDELVSTARYM